MQTFVVRLFVPAAGDPVPFCGFVTPVGAHGTTAFHDADGLLAALREARLPSEVPAAATDRKEKA
jgi:hypothetical protein